MTLSTSKRSPVPNIAQHAAQRVNDHRADSFIFDAAPGAAYSAGHLDIQKGVTPVLDRQTYL
jgi:hypothetical protein